MTARVPSAPTGLRLVPGDGTGAPPVPVDDAVLLAAVRAGDASAAAAFCRRIRPLVERTVRRLLGRLDDDVQDLVQSALIALVYEIDRFRGECGLDHWVSTVTAHLVYKHIRRRRLERRLFSRLLADDGSLLELPAPGTSPYPRAMAGRILEIVDGLSEKLAWTFVLHDVCGYELREIAGIMRTSVTAAQSRLVRGRKELHRRIARIPDLAEMLIGGEEPPR